MSLDHYNFFITDQNVWSEVISGQDTTWGRPALFLDRDGVIVEEVNYLHRPEDVTLIPGAAEVISHANTLNIPVIIVTNQAGIGRRYYDWNHFLEVQKKIFLLLSAAGATIDAVFACPHHSDARPPYYHKNHPCRKPNPGLLTMAETLMAIDLNGSWIAGDRSTDLRAGLNAGCAGGIHLQTGHGIRDIERETSLALANTNFAIQSLPSISEMLFKLPLFKQQLH
jgi:D-glycero-D-manno-heptose 1,7-bisphosphate phosphatase